MKILDSSVAISIWISFIQIFNETYSHCFSCSVWYERLYCNSFWLVEALTIAEYSGVYQYHWSL